MPGGKAVGMERARELLDGVNEARRGTAGNLRRCNNNVGVGGGAGDEVAAAIEGFFSEFGGIATMSLGFDAAEIDIEEFCAERTEILRHKWIESEKAGRDIGFEVALIDWSVHHRTAWRRAYVAKLGGEKKA